MSRLSYGNKQAKKVSVPVVPDVISTKDQRPESLIKQLPSNYGALETLQRTQSPFHSDKVNGHSQSNYNANAVVYAATGNCITIKKNNAKQRQPKTSIDTICEDQSTGTEMTALGASPVHRNSAGSSSSQTSSGFESMKSSTQTCVVPVSNPTLRGESPASRHSVHSSSSGGSLGSGSLERLDEGVSILGISHANVQQLLMNGIPETDVLGAWLADLHMEEYLQLFLNQGYDIPTLSRMTPEDLTAIGITKPGHRKRLTLEIHKLHITDSWPLTAPPAGLLREWLSAIGLKEYIFLFESQGYTSLKDIAQLTWEDFEDIGIKRLGHLKKLGLAIKKIKDYRLNGPSGAPDQYQPTTVIHLQNGRTTAQIKPYYHNPGQLSTTNNSFMDTFQQSPCHLLANGPSDYFGTFPRRNSHHQVVMTEAMVHDSCDSQRRPSVQVVRPVAKLSASQETITDCDQKKNDEKRLAFRLKLHSPGRILSNEAKNEAEYCTNDEKTVAKVCAENEQCDPPPPIACEGPIRRLQSVISVNSSSCSRTDCCQTSSSSSTETLPFANENCGTIKNRSVQDPSSWSNPVTPRRNLSSSSSNGRNSFEGSSNYTCHDNRRVLTADSDKGDVLNDIGHMLQNLTEELDAMLYTRSKPPKN